MALHAQDDFERRRAELEQSRQSILKRMEGDSEEEDGGAAEAPVDPAVERSLLAAKSLQELMRSGGLQSEEGDGDQPGFADLLANAEPLPGGAVDLGPSSLFEANRGADGTLDIESILQQRARMAAVDESGQAEPSQTKASMLDLSQSATKPPKRPVIEVLDANGVGRASPVAEPLVEEDDEDALHTSAKSQDASDESSEASSDSDDSSDSEDAENDSDAKSEQPTSSSSNRQNAVPHPMDQIAIVDGVFQIIPAAAGDASRQHEANDEESSADEEDEADSDEDEHMIGASHDDDEEGEEDDEDDDDMEDDQRRDYNAPQAYQQYHDGFGGASTRDLLFEGPTGDADEPIVLSDSDDDDDDDDAGEQGRQDDAADEESNVEESEEDAQDELVDESDDESENGVQSQTLPSQRQYAARETEEQVPLMSLPASAQMTPLRPNRAHLLKVLIMLRFSSYVAGSEADAVPDSEVEPEEYDEELRWSDLDVNQPSQEGFAQSQQELAPADAAFRAIQGSRTMPGFVTASQLFADIQAAAIDQGAAEQPSEPLVDSSAQPIDPQLLASFIGNEEAIEHAATQEDLHADAGRTHSTQDHQAAVHHETDIFDAFTRQDVPANVREDVQEAPATAARSVTTDAEERRDDTKAETKHSESAPSEQGAMQPDVEKEEEVPVHGRDSLQQLTEAPTESELNADAKGGPTSPIHNEPKVENAEAPSHAKHAASVEETVSAVEEAVSPSKEAEPERSSTNPQDDESLQATSSAAALPEHARISDDEVHLEGDNEDDDEPVERIKPVLARIESTSVLEADVEDNNEEEAAIEEPAVDTAGTPTADTTSPAPFVASEESTAGAENIDNADVVGETADDILLDQTAGAEAHMEGEVIQPHNIVAATEEEGILSGDLADRDSSVERQAVPLNGEPLVATFADDDTPKKDEISDARTAEVSALPPALPAPAEADAANEEPQREDKEAGQDEKAEQEDAPIEADHHQDGQSEVKEMPDEEDMPDEEEMPKEEEMLKEEEQLEEKAGLAAERVDEQSVMNQKELHDGEEFEEKDSLVTEQQVSQEVKQATREDDQPVEGSEHKKTQFENTPIAPEAELPAIDETDGSRKDADSPAPVSAGLSSQASVRVPPSPASSDRRSTSSFTPSANRQGHRHLHGAVRRNLFSQMTEAASNFASSLTAPLRALPALLPIRESQADEAREEDEQAEATAATQSNTDGQASTQQPAVQKGRQAQAVKFTMNTRSHCLYRRLELSDMPGSPVFIVPGCSINHMVARDEKARDLGETSEQNSDNWVDVDPDLLRWTCITFSVASSACRFFRKASLQSLTLVQPKCSSLWMTLRWNCPPLSMTRSAGRTGFVPLAKAKSTRKRTKMSTQASQNLLLVLPGRARDTNVPVASRLPHRLIDLLGVQIQRVPMPITSPTTRERSCEEKDIRQRRLPAMFPSLLWRRQSRLKRRTVPRQATPMAQMHLSPLLLRRRESVAGLARKQLPTLRTGPPTKTRRKPTRTRTRPSCLKRRSPKGHAVGRGQLLPTCRQLKCRLKILRIPRMLRTSRTHWKRSRPHRRKLVADGSQKRQQHLKPTRSSQAKKAEMSRSHKPVSRFPHKVSNSTRPKRRLGTRARKWNKARSSPKKRRQAKPRRAAKVQGNASR